MAGSFKQRYPDLYRVDLETGTLNRVTFGAPSERRWVVDANGKIIAESEYEPNDSHWKVFLPGSPSSPILSGSAKFSFRLAGLSRSDGTVLVSKGGEEGEIVELHLDSGRTESFLPPGKVLDLIRSPTTHLLLGAVLFDDNQNLLFDPTLARHI